MAGGGGASLEYTPTWVVAAVCTVFVAISLIAERVLHYAGKFLLAKKQNPLYEALLKIKEELMLLGFISLLLAVCQGKITAICIPKHYTNDWLPCKKVKEAGDGDGDGGHHRRRLLAAAAASDAGHCQKQGKAPLLSLDALHDLHIFIFVLAVVHVVFTALTILFGTLQLRRWKPWEDALQEKEQDKEAGQEMKMTYVRQHSFIRGRLLCIGKYTTFLGWVHSFLKQFYGAVDKSDYTTLRHGFIMNHYKDNPKFNFYKYMLRALENDFRCVVGICWYLWIFVVVFLLLNVHGWHAYFWIAFVPLLLLLVVGTKLEHIITELAEEVAQRHTALTGDLVIKPSDHHFWFHKPRLVLVLIHVILFQNSFEIAIFFWMWITFGFDSCIMGQAGYIIPRLIIGVMVQFLCSYSTLPLYAIVAQMGSSFNRAIIGEHIHTKLSGWAQGARRNVGNRKATGMDKDQASGSGSGSGSNT